MTEDWSTQYAIVTQPSKFEELADEINEIISECLNNINDLNKGV